MAITSKLAGKLMDKLLSGSTLNWPTDEVRVALLTSAGLAAWNQDTITTIAELIAAQAAWEIATGGNYTQGGVALGSKTLAYDATNNYVQCRAAATTWAGATISAFGAVVFKYSAGVTANQFIINVVDFGGVQSSSNGDYTLTWDATEGVCRFQALPTS